MALTVLVLGGTGKTGRLLVEQLLERGHMVRAIVRSAHKLPASLATHPNLTIVQGEVLRITDEQFAETTEGCDAFVSCLGHTIDFKGIFGEPRYLCTDAARRVCEQIGREHRGGKARFILMNTVGVANPELAEKRTRVDRALLTVLRHTLPPHRDNERAAAYLQATIGRQHPLIEWCSVRPDSLVDERASAYEVRESPETGILTGRPTSRANVADFMCTLLEDEGLWETWRFRMPVLMNRP